MKKILFDKKAREALFKGQEVVYKAVASTLGPSGKNVLIETKNRGPYVTKDGATVAKYIEVKDPFENQGVQLLQQISKKTATEVGDGTTTATIIGHHLIKNSLSLLDKSMSPVLLEKGMKDAAKQITEYLRKHSMSTQHHHILEIAKMSVNGDEKMAGFVAKAFETGDSETAVMIEDNHLAHDEIEIVNGWQWGRGYFSQVFVNESQRMRSVLHDPLVFITNQEISSPGVLIPILATAAGVDWHKQAKRMDGASEASPRPLVIIAKDITGGALATLIQNQQQGGMAGLICAVRAPGYAANMDEYLKDIQAFTGGKFWEASSLNAINKITIEDLGSSEKIVTEANKTSIIGCKNSTNLEDRLTRVRCLEKQVCAEYERKDLRQRISKLKGRIVQLKVGASTEVEANEKKDRYEDALYSVKSALESGHLPGGGSVSNYLGNHYSMKVAEGAEGIGQKLLINALKEPSKVLFGNADRLKDLETMTAINKLHEISDLAGYDLQNPKSIACLLVHQGIIEPTEVIITAIQQAVSMAATVLKTATIIVWEEDVK